LGARLLEWVELKAYEKRIVDGLLLVSEKNPEQVVEALNLIRNFDPVRYNRLRRDVRRIWVKVIPTGMANFEHSTWTCNLDPRYMKDQPAESIACTIVHEATHARLFRRGIDYEEERRARVEQICLRRELAFASKLPAGADAGEHAKRILEALPDFSQAAMVEREFTGALRALLHLGTPPWLAQAVVSFHRWRHKLRSPAEKR
jgi:hypothetical protein